MSLLADLEAPWCLLSLLVIGGLLVLGAAIVAWQQRRPPRVVGFPSDHYPVRHAAASAALEGLAALQSRLQVVFNQLPPDSPDAIWLAHYLQQLRAIMDTAYDRIAATDPPHQAALLERVNTEVRALASVINLHLHASLGATTDREALEAQLAALGAAVNR